MSWFSKQVNSLTGKTGRDKAGRDIAAGADRATSLVSGAYPKAQTYMSDAYKTASGGIKGGYGAARSSLGTGFNEAKSSAKGGYDLGIGTIREGYGKAQGYYDSPEMVASRQELSNRILGKGGYSPETTEAMKASAREEFGSGLRGIEQTLGSYYGDSGASGMAGENFARAGTQMAGDRARAIRDIDIGNEQLRRGEQGAAIESVRSEASQRAGLSADEARFISGLQTEQGRTIGDIMKDQGIAMANLSTEEAQFLANLDYKYGAELANLTTEEATILANIATGKGAAMAGTRDTQGIMPLVSAAVGGIAGGLGQAYGKSLMGR